MLLINDKLPCLILSLFFTDDLKDAQKLSKTGGPEPLKINAFYAILIWIACSYVLASSIFLVENCMRFKKTKVGEGSKDILQKETY